jgi:hypothetical protein
VAVTWRVLRALRPLVGPPHNHAHLIPKSHVPPRLPAACSPTKDGVDVGQKKWALVHSGFQFAVWEAQFD